jgi:hypothetical protein
MAASAARGTQGNRIMSVRRHLQAFAAIGMALAPVIVPEHMQPTLIGRRAAQEIIERVDQHAREQGLTRAHQAMS